MVEIEDLRKKVKDLDLPDLPEFKKFREDIEFLLDFEKMMEQIEPYLKEPKKAPESSRWQYDLIQTRLQMASAKLELAETRQKMYFPKDN